MADTVHTPLDGDWKELTAALSFTSGKTYVTELVSNDRRAVAELVDSTENTPPAAAKVGHRLYPGTDQRPADYGRYTAASGSYWWGRVLNGAGYLVATETT